MATSLKPLRSNRAIISEIWQKEVLHDDQQQYKKKKECLKCIKIMVARLPVLFAHHLA
ncbi:hypothetical protein HanPSC8_Chr17g0749031 [Helianthus annuus]|nr:hypothetical protein HanPSC8_Chr17g0749031 [Helianthus annuus]